MSIFKFKYFDILQADNAMKVGTDAMLLGAFVDAFEKKNMLDIGTGTGVLSLMIAQKNSKINIVAVELDQLSAKECAMNFANSNWSDRLKVHQGDFMNFDANHKFDLIITNPPFYQSRLLNDDSRRAAARHENSLPMARLLDRVINLLDDDGEFWLIVPTEDVLNWEKEAALVNLHPKKRIDIYGKAGGEVKRTIVNFCKTKMDCVTSTFCVRANNNYTKEYISLTQDFHHTKL